MMRRSANEVVPVASGRKLYRPWFAVVAALGAAASSAAGCASLEPKYQPSIDEDVVCVSAADLGVLPEAIGEPGNKTLDAQASVARFPTGVSVVRVAAVMDEENARRHLRVADMPQECAVSWGHLWDDLPPIREVTTLGTLGLDPRGTAYEDLLRESVEINCGLCLIYARVEDTDADAELVAVLWDAANHQALAAFRVPVTLTEEVREACEKSHRGGAWISEAEFRAEADLRRLVRDTMWDIVGGDQAAPTTQPSPWQEYLPVFPRDYDRFRSIDRILRRKP